jgi:hypothetical protein
VASDSFSPASSSTWHHNPHLSLREVPHYERCGFILNGGPTSAVASAPAVGPPASMPRSAA